MLRLLLCVAAYCTAVDDVESREARGATYVRTCVHQQQSSKGYVRVFDTTQSKNWLSIRTWSEYVGDRSRPTSMYRDRKDIP